MKYIPVIAALMFSLILAGCRKTGGDTPPSAGENSSDVVYTITTMGNTSELGTLGSNQSGIQQLETAFITWTDAYVTTDEIKFVAKGDDDKIEYKSKANRYINIFDAISDIGTVMVPPGAYKKIEFKISFAPDGGHAALEVSGILDHNGVQIPVTLRIDKPFEVKFEKTTPTTIDVNTLYTVLNTFDIGALMSGITEEMLLDAVGNDGLIFISSTSNKKLFDIVSKTLESIAKAEIKRH